MNLQILLAILLSLLGSVSCSCMSAGLRQPGQQSSSQSDLVIKGQVVVPTSPGP